MRYGLIPQGLLERVALAGGQMPEPAIDALYSILKSRSIMAGVRLGVFEALSGRPATAEALAGALELDAGVLELLLRTLVFAGYLRESKRGFALSRLSRRTLVPGARMELRGFLLWNYTQWEMIARLEEVVRTGKGVDFHATLKDPEAWGHYQRAMLEIARFDAPTLAKRVPVRKGATRLLDVAGAHGLLGAAICRRHPPLRSTVLDLPAAIPHARALAEEAGHADLVEFHEGDLQRENWGDGWDVVLLANILHHFQPKQNTELAAKARSALAPGGTVAIWEIERPRRDRKAGDGDGAALYFRLTSNAGTYTGEEYAELLRTTLFERVRIERPALAPGYVLVTGRMSAGFDIGRAP
jgi:2-polyprenyl-3-methyl-5-hydroxy-6-metoxy-1,4-benzoquinol methylase